MKITAVIAVYNEEANIKDCIESVKFADEIVVVDSSSVDRTVQIAQTAGAKVIQSQENYPEYKKNMGARNAANRWVMVIDADERADGVLAEEISGMNETGDYAGFYIRRRNYFLGRYMRFGGWGNDRVIRLYDRTRAVYPDRKVHGELEVEGKTGLLKGCLEHRSYETLEDYFEKLGRYSRWSAEDNRNTKFAVLKLFFNPGFRFLRMYILKLGFLDGIMGFILAVTASFSVFIKYTRIFLAKRKSEG